MGVDWRTGNYYMQQVDTTWSNEPFGPYISSTTRSGMELAARSLTIRWSRGIEERDPAVAGEGAGRGMSVRKWGGGDEWELSGFALFLQDGPAASGGSGLVTTH